MKAGLMQIKALFFENRSLHQIILKNTIWLALSEFVGKIAAFLAIVIIARHYGPDNYGKFAFAMSFAALSSIFSDFGINTLTVRELSRDKSKTAEYIDGVLIVKAVISIFIFGSLTILTAFMGKGPEINAMIYFLVAAMMIETYAVFFQSIFIANEKMQHASACRIVVDFVQPLIMLWLIKQGASIVEVNYSYIISAVIGFFISSFIVWKYFSKFFGKTNIKTCISIFKKAWSFCLIAFLFVVYYYLASIWLGFTRTNAEVGVYNVAFKTSFFATSFAAIVFTSFLPSISKFFKEDAEKLNGICSKYAISVLSLGVPIGFGGTVLAQEIINFFYKSAYAGAVFPFQILSWAVAVNFLQCIYCNCLLACDKQKDTFLIVALGLSFNVLLNFFLIGRYGVAGAAWGILLTEIFIFLVAKMIFDKISKINIFKALYPALFSSLVMCACLVAAKVFILNVIILLLLGIIAYFASIYLFLMKKPKHG